MPYATPRRPKGSVGGSHVVRLPPSDLDHGDYSEVREPGRECWGCDQPTFYARDVWSWRQQKWLCPLCFSQGEGINMDGFKEGFNLAMFMVGWAIRETSTHPTGNDSDFNDGWDAAIESVRASIARASSAVHSTLSVGQDEA